MGGDVDVVLFDDDEGDDVDVDTLDLEEVAVAMRLFYALIRQADNIWEECDILWGNG